MSLVYDIPGDLAAGTDNDKLGMHCACCTILFERRFDAEQVT